MVAELNVVDVTRGILRVGRDTRGDLGNGYYKNSLGTRLQLEAMFFSILWYASNVKTAYYAASTDKMTTKDAKTQRVQCAQSNRLCNTRRRYVCAWADVAPSHPSAVVTPIMGCNCTGV
mmetsp:Transcript_46075/g.55451  ORF Transcript_46075/g.55451 Transcript_46075/m.55451 type:complete len:119 (+) Transcript_46075:216-572(+)